MISLAAAAVLATLLGQTLGAGMAAPSGSIEGAVLRAGADEPIRGARVELKPLNSASPSEHNLVAFTDARGRFLFSVAPGPYRMELAADGYARMQYGQRAPIGLETSSDFGLGTIVAVKAGEKIDGLVARLTPTGSISGYVRDAKGRPAAKLPVQLFKPVYSSDGSRTLALAAHTQTDDRGAYRLYWITPGRYFLGAGYSSAASFLPSALGAPPTLPLRFFPDASGLENATAVIVAAAAELTGLNMVIDAALLHSIRGHAIDLSTGLPPLYPTGPEPIVIEGGPSAVHLQHLSAGGPVPMWDDDNYDPESGAFEFQDIPPGTYLIGIPDGRLVRVEVANSDIEGLLVTSAPNISIPVKIMGEGVASSSLDWYRAFALEDMRTVKAQQPDSRILIERSDSSFKLDMKPGTYRFIVPGSLPGFYLKAASYQGKDALNEVIDVSTREPGELHLVLGSNPGLIEGAILDGTGRPVAGKTAVLIPNDHRHRTDLYRTAVADETGRFVLSDVPPGAYRLYAWELIERYSWFDAEVLANYEASGVPVSISESSKESVVLRLIQ